MIKTLHIRNFTVFSDAELHFCQALNIITGENGAGKTHLLKLAYAPLAVCAEEGIRQRGALPTKTLLQPKIAEKLVGVFRPESLGRLARRRQGRERCDVELSFREKEQNLAFAFSSNSKSEVAIQTLPRKWESSPPVFLPTRELMTLFPNFISVYEGHYLELEETWRDTCLLLGAPVKRGPKGEKAGDHLERLSEAMEGSIELDKNGRFYLRTAIGRMEMPLVAEGLRKVACLAHLISTGVLLDKGYLFWDEPEANLNPQLLKRVVESILLLCLEGIQVFIATHSLFLLRELEIRLTEKRFSPLKRRFFGLHKESDGVEVLQGDSIEDIGDISALDEELMQSERYMETLEGGIVDEPSPRRRTQA